MQILAMSKANRDAAGVHATALVWGAAAAASAVECDHLCILAWQRPGLGQVLEVDTFTSAMMGQVRRASSVHCAC